MGFFRSTTPQIDNVIDLRSAEGLQSALQALGDSPGVIDGLIGKNTRAALSRFQSANGLTANDKPYPDTLAALDSSLTANGITHQA
jgi:peptidoglycan hydrolase-like protein with peptidoglycan-binding domain